MGSCSQWGCVKISTLRNDVGFFPPTNGQGQCEWSSFNYRYCIGLGVGLSLFLMREFNYSFEFMVIREKRGFLRSGVYYLYSSLLKKIGIFKR